MCSVVKNSLWVDLQGIVRMHAGARALVACCALATTPAMHAAHMDRPSNDRCQDAVTITDGIHAFTNIDADTDGPDESACVTFGSEQTYNDIWYRYTAPVDGILTISTCNTIDYDSRIAIYTGTCDKLVEYACNDDSTGCTGYSSYLLCHGIAGMEYLVRIGSYNEGNTGTGTFTIETNDPCDYDCPTNGQSELEQCGQNINDGCFTMGGEQGQEALLNEQITPGIPMCGTWYFNGQFRDTDWFEFEVPEPGGYVSASLFSSDRVIGNIYLAHASCPANIIRHTFGGCPTTIESDVLPPGTYRAIIAPGFEMEVGCDDSMHMDRYVLNLDVGTGNLTAPTNDKCEDALLIASGRHDFSTLLADTDGPSESPPWCSQYSDGIGADIWFRYVSSCAGEVTASICGMADYDTRIEIWQGGCGGEGELVACNDDGPECTGFTSMVQFDGECGVEYLVRVGGYDAAWGTGTLEITCVGNCDCNGNGVDDALDIADGTSADCNGNDIPDECDIASGAEDCNGNSLPDSCEIASGTAADTNLDGIPDECQCEEVPAACCPADLDGDGIVAGADLALLLGAWGTSELDLDGDGIVAGSDLALILGSWGDC